MKKILSLMVSLCILIACMSVSMIASADGETNYALASNGTTISGVMTDDLPNVIDGNSETAAWMRKASTNASITLTFENYVDLSRVNMLTSGKNYAYWQVEASYDGVTWFPLTYKGVTTGNNGLYFEPSADTDAVAKYLKIANIWEATFFIYEVEALGTEVTGFPYLKSLTSETGTWTTAFDQSTTSYKVQVDSLENLPALNYEVLMEDATVQYTEASADNNYTATVAVTHGGETATYTVQFVLYNWALPTNGATITSSRALTGNEGTLNAFDGSLSTYSYFTAGQYIQVEFDSFVNVSEVAYYCNNSNISMSYSFDGTVWNEMSLSNSTVNGSIYLKKFAVSGGAVAKYVKVVASSSCIPYEFEVYGTKVNGLPQLKALSSTEGVWSSAFAPGTTSYKVYLEDLESLPTLTYEALMSDASVQYTEASAENNNTATITVTHGTETLTYTIEFVRLNLALAVNGTTVSATNTSDFNLINDGDSVTTYPCAYFRAANANESSITLSFATFVEVESFNLFANSLNYSNYSIKGSLDGNVWFDLDASVSKKDTCLAYSLPQAKTLKYIKIENVSSANIMVYEFEVYGKNLTESDMPCVAITNAEYDEETFTATVTVNLVNVGTSEVSDKYYLFAVYVDDVFYGVDKIDKSATKIAAGNVGTPAVLNVKLPDGTDSSRVTGKLFVWSDSVTIVPVTTPFDVL